MKAIMVMFDSLNRHMLAPYGCDWVQTPNFTRLAERAATFDTAYVGSVPTIPARRELHAGRYHFLHRSWGPIEPFDDSMPEILKTNGVHTHLTSDGYHYWEDGGATYHTRYSTWEASRGQEGDAWKGDLTLTPPDSLNNERPTKARQDFVNRSYMDREDKMPQAVTFARGLEFLRTNAEQDNWFCQIETFDPHEPYFVPKKYAELYPHTYDGKHFDWPYYRAVTEDAQTVEHLRCLNAALTTMCDAHLGTVLDLMDELNLWDDTMLIVNTDHGFLLGEHQWWAKVHLPFYEEVSHSPLFIWDPRGSVAGERRTSLVQTIDLPATLLEYFGVERPADMQGVPLRRTIADDTPVREAGLFGVFGGHVNVTDGRYVYWRGAANAANAPLHEHTLMPTHMRRLFSVDELQDIHLAEPFTFTKGCRTMRIPSRRRVRNEPETRLWDLHTDPHQEAPLDDAAVERRMIDHLVDLMRANDAPAEQYERLGLNGGL
ncbi:MAG: sulfatase [Planctomycetota bacterium]